VVKKKARGVKHRVREVVCVCVCARARACVCVYTFLQRTAVHGGSAKHFLKVSLVAQCKGS
jgi:hypothetical protein